MHRTTTPTVLSCPTLTGEVVEIVLKANQPTNYTYEPGLTAIIVVIVVENKGGAEIAPQTPDKDVCSVSTPDQEAIEMQVVVDFKKPGTCRLDFDLAGDGIFHFALELPSPIVLIADE